ncbi:hypothetical protein [Actinophytocola algeriensis]|uniref:Uncharacterized protein n=1 Tax=Actinophytocola algeriensis TaxID=1768010 RepID=A0A7W7VDI5_9PSEU|nr:hypothetical protein [Actinophytocola algeriensis]MBB4906211.1 hypothetical protein [Actinophytocola algeriensis]MBE1472104.1 hypothetical protein [Actinophytocola algeriensis]
MAVVPPFPGAIITYHDPTRPQAAPFQRAVAMAGADLVDPQDRTRWAPVMHPDGTRSLVQLDWIVDVTSTVSPPSRQGQPSGRRQR